MGALTNPAELALADVESQLTGSVAEIGVENSCNVRQSSRRGHVNVRGIDGIVLEGTGYVWLPAAVGKLFGHAVGCSGGEIDHVSVERGGLIIGDQPWRVIE